MQIQTNDEDLDMKEVIGKKFRRALHFDFHTSPGVDNILGNFDAEKFAEQLNTAHIEYINVAARCNMGYSYYKTEVGKKYPGLEDHDLLDEVITACHKRNIGVSVYLNVGLDHEIAADHRDWLKVERDGRIYRDNKMDNFFRVMCYNSPYREHFLTEIREVSRYDVDGIFCDCFWLRECFCPECMRKMARLGVDINDNNAVLDYQNQVRYEFADEILDALGDKRGRIKCFFNALSIGSGVDSHAEIECLTTDNTCWGYDYFDAYAAYARTMYKDRVYMSGRFQNTWGDFGGIKTLASMQNDLYDAMMNSYGISYGDHLHPIDGFEPEVAMRVGKVMEEKIKYEPYTEHSENAAEVGILIKSWRSDSKFPTPAVRGAIRMLKELKITYNVYDENGEFENDGIKLLIVAEQMPLDGGLGARLKTFSQNGGKLIFAGEVVTGAREAGFLEFVEVIGEDVSDNAYFTFGQSGMRFAMYEPSKIIKNVCGREVSKYVKNIMNFTWDGRQATFYRPQGEITEYSAAVIKDTEACVCFDIFSAYANNFLTEHRDLVAKLIDELLSEKLIESPLMPKTATVSLTEHITHKILHVKATYPEHKMDRGIIEEHTYMKNVPISVLGEYEVFKLPDMSGVESEVLNGRTVFMSGDILGYQAYLLK